MHRLLALLATTVFAFSLMGGMAYADGPSGSTQCHLSDDDCDGVLDEDPIGDANGDGVADDDGDGRVDEDPLGDAADDAGENQTNCNEGSSTNVGGVGYAYAGSNGAEVCADEGSAAPVDGSATVDAEDGYVAIDGDNGNPGASNGYARVDEEGVHCGDETNQDSGADQTNNTPEDCG